MEHRIRIVAWIAASLGLVLIAHSAGGAGSHSIAQALESVAIGQHFSVEGVVVERTSDRFFMIRDESGVMPVVIPENMTRSQGVPEIDERIRVSGKFDSKKLDSSVRGMRVAYLERMGVVTGGRGSPAPADAQVVPIERAAPPAAMQSESSVVTTSKPVLGEALVNEMRLSRRSYDAARGDAEEAASIYARAAFLAGKDASVDPAVVAQLEQAEARVKAIQSGVPALSARAREAGLEENLIGMFEDAMGLH